MATVLQSVATGNSLSAADWHALHVVGKEAAHVRSDLQPGQHPVDVTVRIRGTLKVGRDSDGATSVTPSANELLAVVLSKLNAVTREKILRELPNEFEANGNQMPEVETSLVDAAAGMLSRLRRKVDQHRKGAVTGEFQIEAVEASAPQLKVVG